MKSSSMLAILLAAATLATAGADTNPPARPAKTVRVMAIGNSFSRDALTHLPFIVEAAGHRLVSANAIILGGSLEDHAKALEAFDADPASSSGHYLLGCVWFEFLFGESVLDSPYQSPYVAVEDTPILKRIAHAVVGEGRSEQSIGLEKRLTLLTARPSPCSDSTNGGVE